MENYEEKQNQIIDLLERLGNKVERNVIISNHLSNINLDILLKEKCRVLNQEEDTGICFINILNEDELNKLLRVIYNLNQDNRKINHIILSYNEEKIDERLASNLNLHRKDVMTKYGYYSLQSFVECVPLTAFYRNLQEQYDLFCFSLKTRNKNKFFKNEDITNNQYVIYAEILRAKIKKENQELRKAKIFYNVFSCIPILALCVVMALIIVKYNIQILGAILVVVSFISTMSNKLYGKSFVINLIQSPIAKLKTRIHCSDSDIDKIKNEIFQNKISLVDIHIHINHIANKNILEIVRYLLLYRTSNLRNISQKTKYELSYINGSLYDLEKMGVAIRFHKDEWSINENFFAL